MRARVKRTEETAVLELLAFFEQNGRFSSSLLMRDNSGLERWIRVHHEGLRGFCERHGISHILTEPKVTSWTVELAVDTIKSIYEKHRKPVGQSLLTQEGCGGLYQWIYKHHGPYKDFCRTHNILEYAYGQDTWNDAKCFRLVKDYFISNSGPISPEMIKKANKGAYNYIFESHGNFQNFINTYDLHDYINIKDIRYDDELVKRLLKEAFFRKGDRVNAKWLNDNGYGGAYKYLCEKGDGSFIKGCEMLGLSEYATSAYMTWTDEIALEKVKSMYEEKGNPVISADFVKYRLTGLREWICEKYGTLQAFFDAFGISHMFANMAHIGRELWSFGMQYQELAKEAVEILFDDVVYDKWVEHLSIRPDFVIGETGLWIDAKLSSFAYFTDETVEKYTAHDSCKELWLLYLRGHTFRIDNPK